MLTQYFTLSNGKFMSGFSSVVNAPHCCGEKNIYSTQTISSIFPVEMVFDFKLVS